MFLENSEPNENDSLVYDLKIKCTKKDLDALAHKQYISFPGKYCYIVFTLGRYLDLKFVKTDSGRDIFLA